MSWAFLAVSLVGAWFTFNAHVPHFRRGPLSVPSFFAGWLTAELAAHHVTWQAAATALFVWAGALAAWPGWVGLGVTLASWLGLLVLMTHAGRTKDLIEASLLEGLGRDYRDGFAPGIPERLATPVPRSRLVLPFRLTDPDVRCTRDIEYVPGGGPRRSLDVYTPREGARNAPVLLQIHGGGWVISNKRHQALPLMNHLAARGWVCVAANYRLSPRATFPDHLVDLKHSLRWIRENIAGYGGDPDFVVATGGSAGGHLSSLVALTANDPEYQPGFEEVDTSVRACVPFYGVYDFTNRFGHQHHDGMEIFLETVVMKKRLAEDPEAFQKASPMYRVHADAPPFFVVHGTHDSLVPIAEAREFAKLLRETSRAPVVFAELPSAQHAFEVFHSLRTSHAVQGVDRFLAAIYSSYLTERAAA